MMSPGRLTLITHRHQRSVATSITCQPALSQGLRRRRKDKDGLRIMSMQREASGETMRRSRRGYIAARTWLSGTHRERTN